MRESIQYWDRVGSDLESYPPGARWRGYCDGLNRRWLRQILGSRSYRRALKTDLFDEAVGDGIGPDFAERMIGIDVAQSTARLALARTGLPALVSDVRQLPFSGGAFDLVISLSTLDHFTDAREISSALRDIRRVLAPGGTLAITLDNLSNPYVRLRNGLGWRVLRWSRLVPYFVGATLTRGQLERALAENGFRVVSSTAIMHVPRALMVPLSARVPPGVFQSLIATFERMRRWPTRYRTGLFLAMQAEAVGEEGVEPAELACAGARRA